MMEALTAFDAVAIVIVIVSTLMALARGFMRELATLGAFIAAITAAFFANKYIGPTLDSIVPSALPSWTPTAILFLGTFLIIYVIVAWFGASLAKTIQGPEGISLLDRVAGGVFGFARGGVVLIFFVYLLNLTMDEDQVPEFISMARTYPIVLSGADYLSDHIPDIAERGSEQPALDVETTG